MCVQHATAQPQPVSVLTESPIPPELEEILLDCLEKDPNERPPDATELWRRLGDVPVPEAWTQERAEDWWRINEPDDVG